MSKVVFIEFSDGGRPFAAATDDDKYYDIEYYKANDQLFADYSGGGLYMEGADNKYWLAAGYELPIINGSGNPAPPENRLKRKPRKYTGNLWDWAISGQCMYCSVCDDMIPEDALCSHVWWDSETGWWSTPDDRK